MNTPTLWHALPTEMVFDRLHSKRSGLQHSEWLRRQSEFGPNELQAAARVSPWAMLIEQFRNVLILILLAAAALSAFLGHGVEAVDGAARLAWGVELSQSLALSRCSEQIN